MNPIFRRWLLLPGAMALSISPHLAEVPIAIITSSQAMSDKRRVSLIGRTRYIEKPLQLAEFLTTVGQAVKDLLHLNDKGDLSIR
jgi:CheY-like chemotaxis protein